MPICLRPAFAASITTTALGNVPYRLLANEWTTVEDDRDALYMLSVQPWGGLRLEADRELGPLWITSPVERVLRLPKCRGDHGERFEVGPGRLLPITRVQASMISSHELLNSVSCARFLRGRPGARIVVIRGGNLGDVLFVGAAVDKIRRIFPDATVDYVTGMAYAEVAGGITLWEALDRAPYDAVFDFENLLEGSPEARDIDRVRLAARRVGLVDAWPMSVRTTAEDLEYGRQATGAVCLALRSTSAYREMSTQWEVRLVDALRDLPLFTTSRKGARSGVKHYDGTLGQTVGLIAAASVVVAVDSGPLHVAQALGKPVVALFGPVAPHLRVRPRPDLRIFTANTTASCLPCAATFCHCELPAPCLELIDVEAVASAVRELYDGDPPGE